MRAGFVHYNTHAEVDRLLEALAAPVSVARPPARSRGGKPCFPHANLPFFEFEVGGNLPVPPHPLPTLMGQRLAHERGP